MEDCGNNDGDNRVESAEKFQYNKLLHQVSVEAKRKGKMVLKIVIGDLSASPKIQMAANTLLPNDLTMTAPRSNQVTIVCNN